MKPIAISCLRLNRTFSLTVNGKSIKSASSILDEKLMSKNGIDCYLMSYGVAIVYDGGIQVIPFGSDMLSAMDLGPRVTLADLDPESSGDTVRKRKKGVKDAGTTGG